MLRIRISFTIHYSKFTIQAQRPFRGQKMNDQPKPELATLVHSPFTIQNSPFKRSADISTFDGRNINL
jgi:hypothetical protein